MKAVLEGLLFISGDDGLTTDKLCEILELSSDEVKSLIKDLHDDYESNDRGVQIEYLGNHFKLTTKKEHKNYYEKLIEDERHSNLSDSALEVLSIIAYNEPISRVNIDDIRGVNSSYIVRKLLLKDLIEEKGRSDAPGRPLLYGVTQKFLDYFGLGSIKDLPKIEASQNNDLSDNNLFNTKYQEKN